MLVEIRCDRFRMGSIGFHPGLNVILGDENATNSIGKSTLLMVIDFAFGGGSLLAHNQDLTEELGDHEYFFSFMFDAEIYHFRRATDSEEIVFRCDGDYQPTTSMSLDEYRSFLKAAYKVNIEDISFRTLVSLYLRVWGKDNLNVYKPLHVVQTQSSRECINNLIKTFGQYEQIKGLIESLRSKEEERGALSRAFRNQIIPKIGTREHQQNEDKIAQIEREIEGIKANLAKYATNLAEIVNKEVLELKVEKDSLLATKLKLDGQLVRVRQNITNNRHITSRHFSALTNFFPQINQDRLARVEEFHSGVAKLLKGELQETKRDLEEQITRIETDVATIDNKMAQTLASIDKPSHVVDRVYDLAFALRSAKQENEYFEAEEALTQAVQDLKVELSRERGAVIALIQHRLNEGLRQVVTSVFGATRKSPTIEIGENTYSYDVFEDTGTGTAYANLIVFDLTVFGATVLPFIGHDSLLFKNIENDSVANLFNVYNSIEKQSFVAIDEISKYGKQAAEMLRERSVIALDDNHVLYVKDWRTKLP